MGLDACRREPTGYARLRRLKAKGYISSLYPDGQIMAAIATPVPDALPRVDCAQDIVEPVSNDLLDLVDDFVLEDNRINLASEHSPA